MDESREDAHEAKIKRIFRVVAADYELMNSLMTFGQDRVWRKEVILLAGLKPGIRLLDLGAGTGDLTRLVCAVEPGARVIAVDFTLEMMLTGKNCRRLPFVAADTLAIPSADSSFDVIVSGFLMRNMADVGKALREQYRLLSPGGRIVILDTTRPTPNLLTQIIWLHMHLIIPMLGALVSANRAAYEYLQKSSEGFLLAEDLAGEMEAAGFRNVNFKRHAARTIAIHWGNKPR